MRWIILALLLAARADAAAPERIELGTGLISSRMKALPVHVGGRVQVAPLAGNLPAGARSFSHQWPSVYFETAFQGSELLLKFDDPINEYRLLVDERMPIPILQPGKAEARLTGLGRGPHRARLEKVTESPSSRASFQGFYGNPAAKPLPMRPRSRQLEFIGDSAMAGYGARSPERQCTAEQVRRTTDGQQAFPALLAKRYDADYQVNAISGSGLIRNVDGSAPDRTIGLLYPFTFFDRTARYSNAAWKPQIVVVKLQADLVGALKPGEKWANTTDLARDYAMGYGQFLGDLHRRYPAASILIWWFDRSEVTGPDGAALLDAMQGSIAAAARTEGIRQLHFLPVSGLNLERTACAYHYSLADHRVLASYFSTFIDRHRELWGRDR